jgi:hypothetical protein
VVSVLAAELSGEQLITNAKSAPGKNQQSIRLISAEVDHSIGAKKLAALGFGVRLGNKSAAFDRSICSTHSC